MESERLLTRENLTLPRIMAHRGVDGYQKRSLLQQLILMVCADVV